MKLSSMKPRQSGIALLEALVAILIFCLGILGLIGLQGRALSYTGDSGVRGEAVHLAGSYMAQMWAESGSLVYGTGNYATNIAAYLPSGNAYTQFKTQVDTQLPGSQTAEALAMCNGANPQVAIMPLTNGAQQVSMTLCWMLPSDTQAHNYQQISTLLYNS